MPNLLQQENVEFKKRIKRDQILLWGLIIPSLIVCFLAFIYWPVLPPTLQHIIIVILTDILPVLGATCLVFGGGILFFIL